MFRFMLTTMAGLTLLAALPASAENIYCTVTGAKQGSFQSERAPAGNLKAIPVLALTEEVSVSYGASTGQEAGRRTYKPVTIIKLLDGSSPQFFQAAVTNELLRSVVCTFYRNEAHNGYQAYFKITLTNALIVDVKNAGDGVNGDAAHDEHERIEMTFQKIEMEDLDAHTVAADDWSL